MVYLPNDYAVNVVPDCLIMIYMNSYVNLRNLTCHGLPQTLFGNSVCATNISQQRNLDSLMNWQSIIVKIASHEQHKHKDKINTETKRDIFSGTCKDKTARIFLCFIFCSALGLCLDYDLMFMTILMSQAWLSFFVLPFVLSLCLCLRSHVNQTLRIQSIYFKVRLHLWHSLRFGQRFWCNFYRQPDSDSLNRLCKVWFYIVRLSYVIIHPDLCELVMREFGMFCNVCERMVSRNCALHSYLNSPGLTVLYDNCIVQMRPKLFAISLWFGWLLSSLRKFWRSNL